MSSRTGKTEPFNVKYFRELSREISRGFGIKLLKEEWGDLRTKSRVKKIVIQSASEIYIVEDPEGGLHALFFSHSGDVVNSYEVDSVDDIVRLSPVTYEDYSLRTFSGDVRIAPDDKEAIVGFLKLVASNPYNYALERGVVADFLDPRADDRNSRLRNVFSLYQEACNVSSPSAVFQTIEGLILDTLVVARQIQHPREITASGESPYARFRELRGYAERLDRVKLKDFQETLY